MVCHRRPPKLKNGTSPDWLLKLDRESVLHLHGFRPWGGFGPKFSCAAMMEYVDGNAHAIHGATELYCGPATEKVAEPAE